MSYSVIPVFIPHLGCPHDCVFCNQKRIAGTVNAPKPQQVSALLDVAFQKTEDAEVAFYGGSFTALPMEEQEEYLKAAEKFTPRAIRVSTRPDAISDEILALLKKYGVRTVELGAQSMDDKVLKASGRGHDVESVREASRMIKASGLNLILQMMVGLPGEDEDSVMKTAREIAQINPDGVRIYPTVVVRDTCLEEMWRAGKYNALEVERAVDICASLVKVFEEAHIPIIRMGLNPTEDLNGGDALAGAYHPAFGQLVKSKIMLEKLRAKLGLFIGEEIVIYANPRVISEVAGHKGVNKKILMREFALKKITILSDVNIPHDDVHICKK